MERVRGIQRVHDHGLAAQIGEGMDIRLHDQAIEAVIAATDNGDVDLGDIRHGQSVVHCRVDDLPASIGKAGTHLLRSRRDPDVDREPVSGEKTLRLRREQRQVLHALENHDRELRILGTCDAGQVERQSDGHAHACETSTIHVYESSSAVPGPPLPHR